METFTSTIPSALEMRYKDLVDRYHNALEQGDELTLQRLFTKHARDISMPRGYQDISSIVLFGKNLRNYIQELKVTCTAIRTEGDSIICESVFSGNINAVASSFICRERLYIASYETNGIKDCFQCRLAEYSWPIPYKEILHIAEFVTA